MNDVARCFAENLHSLRKHAELSQEELGYRAGLHRTEIGMLERGVRLARVDTILKLAGALGVEPGDLFAGMSYRPVLVAGSGDFVVRKEDEAR